MRRKDNNNCQDYADLMVAMLILFLIELIFCGLDHQTYFFLFLFLLSSSCSTLHLFLFCSFSFKKQLEGKEESMPQGCVHLALLLVVK